MKTDLRKTNLRTVLRERRRSLSESEQLSAAKNLALQFKKSQSPSATLSIAVYSASDGEINPNILITELLNSGNSIALPYIESLAPSIKSPPSESHMSFAPFSKNSTMQTNRYGIQEPVTKQRINCSSFDLVLLPLVAFDSQGKRLGMGGGFYDRAFAFKKRQPNQKPYLIGLAHECQEVETIDSDDWDIPLDAVLTDQRYIPINSFLY